MTDMSEAVTAEEQATQLPVPTGYRMLCALPEVEDKFANGLGVSIGVDYHQNFGYASNFLNKSFNSF